MNPFKEIRKLKKETEELEKRVKTLECPFKFNVGEIVDIPKYKWRRGAFGNVCEPAISDVEIVSAERKWNGNYCWNTYGMYLGKGLGVVYYAEDRIKKKK